MFIALLASATKVTDLRSWQGTKVCLTGLKLESSGIFIDISYACQLGFKLVVSCTLALAFKQD